MYTFGQYVADKEKESEARGEARGETRAKKEFLLALHPKGMGRCRG